METKKETTTEGEARPFAKRALRSVFVIETICFLVVIGMLTTLIAMSHDGNPRDQVHLRNAMQHHIGAINRLADGLHCGSGNYTTLQILLYVATTALAAVYVATAFVRFFVEADAKKTNIDANPTHEQPADQCHRV